MIGRMIIETFIYAAGLVLTSLSPAAAEQGKTRATKYRVNTTIENRLARTVMEVDFLNEGDCATTRGFTMQLPLHARVTDLAVDTVNGCQMVGEVKTVLDAQDEFDAQSSAGKPAALLQAWDASNYPVRVSVPPFGTTTVRVEMEELLSRSNFAIPFQVPLSPGLPVDSLLMEVTVSEPHSGVKSFSMSPLATSIQSEVAIVNEGATSATAKLSLENVTADELPRLLRGSYDYDPELLSSGGIVVGSGACVSHLFNPAALLDTAIDKNIVFVIDVSGSMAGERLDDAKATFETIIDTLTPEDTFTIHTFSKFGTQDSWGPSKATDSAKTDALSFVKKLSAEGGTNLHEAFLDALERVSTIQTMSQENDRTLIPIVMMLSDGEATEGIADRTVIARAVRSKNEGIKAKVFGIAFGAGSDYPLLLGIAIQNEGRAISIREGFEDSIDQMEDFYSAELRRVLLTNLKISLASDTGIESQTAVSFPVFADGSEVFVRAKPKSGEYFQGTIQVVASATAGEGHKEWAYETNIDDDSQKLSSECAQSFAHQKITELMSLKEAIEVFGANPEDYIQYIESIFGGATMKDPINNISSSPAQAIDSYALELALGASLVWPGLTSMVTIENDACAAIFVDGNETCSDGDGIGSEKGGNGWVDDGTSRPGDAPSFAIDKLFTALLLLGMSILLS